MTTSGVASAAYPTTITGNRITITGHTLTLVAGSGETIDAAAISAVACTLKAIGGVHGHLRYQMADPETLEGMLSPSDLKDAQIKLTQGGAGATLALMVEELYLN